MPLRKLFSKEQRAFYDAHAPAGIELNSLLTLGPTFLLRAKHQPKDFKRGITVEMWLYPDGSRILEISTKCLPSDAFQAGAEFKAYLADRGITVVASDETKTKAAMEFFRAGLDAEGAGTRPASEGVAPRPASMAGRDRPPCLLLGTFAARLGEQASDDGAADGALHDRTLHGTTHEGLLDCPALDGLLDGAPLQGLLDHPTLDGLLDGASLQRLLHDAPLHGPLHGRFFTARLATALLTAFLATFPSFKVAA